MGVETSELRGIGDVLRGVLMMDVADLLHSSADELDALRAENANLREERRELARSVFKHPWERRGTTDVCAGCGKRYGHDESCPVALAERVLAEPLQSAKGGAHG